MNKLFAPSSKKGQSNLTGIVMTLVVVAVLLFIGIKITSEVGDSIDRGGFSTAENTTYDNVSGTTLDAFDLTTVALIVLAASGILFIVFQLAR
jgi:hypothetical protein